MPDQVKYIVYKVITAACNRPELGWPYESKAKFKINMLMKIAELTGQTIPVKKMHKEDGFSAKTLGKSLLLQNDWFSSNGLASQYWLLESPLSMIEIWNWHLKAIAYRSKNRFIEK